MAQAQPNNPLHGVTLEHIVTLTFPPKLEP